MEIGNMRKGIKARLGATAAACALAVVGIFGIATPASAAVIGGGASDCGAGTVYVWSSTTGSTYHWLGSQVSGHWFNSTAAFRQSTLGTHGAASWQVQAASIGYGYPKCLS